MCRHQRPDLPGYGAVLYGLRFPRAFAFVASFSGSVGIMRRGPEYAELFKPLDLDRVIGAPGSAAQKENDPLELVQSADPKTVPPLWIACGTDDFLFAENLGFLQQARERKLRLEFHAAPGEHEWVYWDAELPRMLEALASTLGVSHR